MKNNWKKMFRKIILERGEDYCYGGLVSDLKKQDYGYSAVVHGSDDYEVEIFMEDDEVEDMICDCPYADDGNNCKHMAAVLLAISEGDFEEDLSEKESIDDVLKAMSDEDVRKEFYEIVRNDPNIRKRIYNAYRKSGFKKSDVHDFRRALESLAYECGDRDGFIDWRSGYDYVNAFGDCLDDYIRPMIANGEYLLAFEALKEAFEVLNEVEMDGSNGEHSDIAENIKDYWIEIIRSCDEKDRDIIFDWFNETRTNSDEYICGDVLEEVCTTAFDDEKYLLELLQEVKTELSSFGDNYRLEHNLDLYKDLLNRLGRDDSEYEQWLQEHENLTTVIEIRLEDAKRNDDVDEMIRIYELMYGDERFRWKQDYLRELLKLYKRKDDKTKQKEILRKIVFDSKYPKIDDIYELKELCSKDEWSEYRDRLLKENERLRTELYFKEGMFKELADALNDYRIEVADKYAPYLTDFKDDLLKRYLRHLIELEDRYPSRPLYEEMEHYALETLKYDDHGKQVKALLTEWKYQYPSRKMMLKMIDEVIRKIDKDFASDSEFY